MQFEKARRTRSRLRMALTGPAGSGKTYSSLLIAKGIGGKIAMIDTERGSGSLYDHLADYDVLQLTPPFDPRKYIQAIKLAEEHGYHVLIIDSLSHAWAGVGGILDIHDRTTKSTRNSFAAWREVTPQHNQLVDTMLDCRCHLLVTMRTKTAYEVNQENGKTKVTKLGLAPVQRDGLEYEFTLVMDLALEGHVATVSKDRTQLFDGEVFTPSEETGRKLRKWLNGGKDQNQDPYQGKAAMIDRISALLKEMDLAELIEPYYGFLNIRYGVNSMADMTVEQVRDQLEYLQDCAKNQSRMDQLRTILGQLKAA